MQLAELWPAGYMDNLGIKDAVYRAKERKRANYKQKYKVCFIVIFYIIIKYKSCITKEHK